MTNARFTKEELEIAGALGDYLNSNDFEQIWECEDEAEAVEIAAPWESLIAKVRSAQVGEPVEIETDEAERAEDIYNYLNEEDFDQIANGDPELSSVYMSAWETFVLKL